MPLVLHPRVAPGNRIRIWAGASHRTKSPALTWRLDGAPITPQTIAPLQSARGPALVADDRPRTFTGVFDLVHATVTPGSMHRVLVQTDDGESAELQTRSVPQAVPDAMDGWLNVLLVSCFHGSEDRNGLAGTIATQIPAPFKPHLSILMGDQVYLDLPTLQNFRDDAAWLAEKFENDYVQNWMRLPGYSPILAAAPSVSIPDDHEYWNNYPHTSAHIQNTWKAEGRERWRGAAQAMFQAFQLPQPPGFGAAVEIDIDPLSIFVPDGRTFRDPDRAFSMPESLRTQMRAWTTRVADEKKYGVLVTGQSLFDEPVARFKGTVGDWSLSNYGDYGEITDMLVELAGSGRPVLCLTGDVHYGRVIRGRPFAGGRSPIYEIITSPSSLVATIGVDQLKSIGAAIGGLFGKKNPWPRHGEPADPPAFFSKPEYTLEKLWGQKGNQVATLSFRRSGFGLEMLITYWPVSTSADQRPKVIGPYTLSPAQE